MTCEACGGARFEYAGVGEGAVVRLRCTRCTHVVEQAVDAPAGPGGRRRGTGLPDAAQPRTRV